MREQGRRAVGDELPGALIWFVGIVGRIEWERRRDPADTVTSDEEPPPGLTYELIVATAARPAGRAQARLRRPAGRCGPSTATAPRDPRSGARA